MEAIYVILLISISGPVIGSLIGVMKKPSDKFMFNMLAFAAGVMLAISFIDLIPESINLSNHLIASVGVLLGAIVMFILDKLIPHIHPELCKQEQGRNLKRTSIYLMMGIFLHNFPEGMAIGIGVVSGVKASLTIALAIAIHNIPEGIVTSAPYYSITKKRLKSFLVSSSTAIPIVVGFVFANFLFRNIPSNLIGLIIAATAGLMIYISGDELIPTSCNKGSGEWSHSTIFALIFGVIFVIALGAI